MKKRAFTVVVASLFALAPAIGQAKTRSDVERVKQIIRYVFGSHGEQAVRVADCETGHTFWWGAHNGQYRGIFQLGTRERAQYGDGHSTWEQAVAAYKLFLDRGWAPWDCSP